MPTDQQLADLLRHATPAFDAEWYAHQYKDSAHEGFSAESHFLSVGHRLHRGTGPLQPVLPSSAGLAVALARRRFDGLEVNRLALSYCIPVMSRLHDLKLTLAENLHENRAHRDRIEFLILAFEDEAEVAPWVKQNFREELADGYLRLVSVPALRQWHFGKAKNAFRPYIAGRLYSSLDADNFVTEDETRLTLDLLDSDGTGFLMHHFSGTWGDGSSGRLTLPTWLYRRSGYDEHFLPRQFDEVDAILSALVHYPNLTLYHYDVPEAVLDTDNIRAFLRAVPLRPRVRVLPVPRRRAALNPKSHSYVADNRSIAAQQSLNEAMCFLKHLSNLTGRAQWQRRIERDASDLIASTEPYVLAQMVLGADVLQQLDGLLPGIDIYVAGSAAGCIASSEVAEVSGKDFAILHVSKVPASATFLPKQQALAPVSGGAALIEILWFPVLEAELMRRKLCPISWIL